MHVEGSGDLGLQRLVFYPNLRSLPLISRITYQFITSCFDVNRVKHFDEAGGHTRTRSLPALVSCSITGWAARLEPPFHSLRPRPGCSGTQARHPPPRASVSPVPVRLPGWCPGLSPPGWDLSESSGPTKAAPARGPTCWQVPAESPGIRAGPAAHGGPGCSDCHDGAPPTQGVGAEQRAQHPGVDTAQPARSLPQLPPLA